MKEEKDPRGAKEDLFPREVSVNRARIEERLLATEILSLNFRSPRTDVSAEEMPLAKTASKVRASARTRRNSSTEINTISLSANLWKSSPRVSTQSIRQ